MPTYDYKCAICEEIHEEIHGMNEAPHISCGNCGGPCIRQIAKSAFILNGRDYPGQDIKRGETHE